MANEEHLSILKNGVEKWNKWREEKQNIKPDLRKADLRSANLSDANLSVANLTEAKLGGTNLTRVDLTGADLTEANFSDKKIDKSKTSIISSFYPANLSDANLTHANLTKAHLERATFINAVLSGANLFGADLTGADFTEAHLFGANLTEADLTEAKLGGTYLMGTNLTEAKLFGADLTKANLTKANLTGTDLTSAHLSGAVIDGDTYRSIKAIKKSDDIKIGINGFWCKSSNSAALMIIDPPADSMHGPNPDAVVESLKRSRSIHFYSLTLASIALLIIILGLEQIKLPFFSDIKVSPIRYAILAMSISVGVLGLVKMFMQDALQGVRYLQDQKSAMTVGHFPWVLSKYAGNLKENMIQSFITRLVMAFHPLIYLYFFIRWDRLLDISKDEQLLSIGILGKVILIIPGVLLLFLCIYIFVLSQRFQKPILFDAKTEKKRKSEIEKQTDSVKELTSKIEEMVNLQKQRSEVKTKPNKNES